jgi:hemoglobin
MDIFYAKIRADENGVGEIFNNAVGTSDEAWTVHKKKIGEFWRGMLLGTGNFRGNPPQAHMNLPPFPPEYFDIWLGLFEESLNEVFTVAPATQILQRAQMIAMGFKSMLYK